MTEEINSVYHVHSKRISNRIGTKEIDEQDGWVWYSRGYMGDIRSI
jgi:hypothetical protein